MSTHTICLHRKKGLLMSTHNICFLGQIGKLLSEYPLIVLEQLINTWKRAKLRVNMFSTSRLLINDLSVLQNR